MTPRHEPFPPTDLHKWREVKQRGVRKKRTERLQNATPQQVGTGAVANGSVSTIYGLESLASTTSHRTSRDQVLSELLNSLENEVEILESKYFEVLNTLTSVTEILVRHYATTIKEGGTEESL